MCMQKDIQTAVGQLIVEIEVGGLFIVPVDFVLFLPMKKRRYCSRCC